MTTPRERERIIPIGVFVSADGTRYREQLYVREHIGCDGHKISTQFIERIKIERVPW